MGQNLKLNFSENRFFSFKKKDVAKPNFPDFCLPKIVLNNENQINKFKCQVFASDI